MANVLAPVRPLRTHGVSWRVHCVCVPVGAHVTSRAQPPRSPPQRPAGAWPLRPRASKSRTRAVRRGERSHAGSTGPVPTHRGPCVRRGAALCRAELCKAVPRSGRKRQPRCRARHQASPLTPLFRPVHVRRLGGTHSPRAGTASPPRGARWSWRSARATPAHEPLALSRPARPGAGVLRTDPWALDKGTRPVYTWSFAPFAPLAPLPRPTRVDDTCTPSLPPHDARAQPFRPIYRPSLTSPLATTAMLFTGACRKRSC